MTITDDPNGDAAHLDDDALLEACLDGEATTAARSPPANEELPEWPPVMMQHIGLAVDVGTLAWFRTNHADWQREIGLVLRAWVTAQSSLYHRR